MTLKRPRAHLLIQQPGQRHGERVSNPSHHEKARVLLAPLDPSQIRQINLGIERKLLLRHFALLTQPTNIPPEYPAPVPHLQNGTRSGI